MSPLHRRWPNGRGHAQTGTGHRPAAFMPRRPPFAPSRPQPGPRPVRCHLGIPHGPIPALPVDALAFGIVDIPWCRNATVGTAPPRKLGCGLNLAARGRIKTRYLMGRLTDLTNEDAIKWVGRSQHKLLLAALNSCRSSFRSQQHLHTSLLQECTLCNPHASRRPNAPGVRSDS